VFTAGIGENSALVGRMVCSGMSFLRIELDEHANRDARAVERTSLRSEARSACSWSRRTRSG
jgi:acetate kinase